MKKILFGVIFFLIGAGLLVGDFYMIKSTTAFLSDSEKIEGVVTNIISSRSSDGDIMYSPEVTFTDASNKNVTFKSNISSTVAGYTVGEKVPVIYNKSNSQNAKINTFFQLWFGVIIMSILGVIFFLVGLGIIISAIRVAALKKEMLMSGTKISAKVISVESNSSTQISTGEYKTTGRNSYQIVAQWLNPSDNQMYVFRSDNLSYNPESFTAGKDIIVYIDQSNPKRYYMDLSSLPQAAN